jgi:hypothetical protein
VKRLVLYLQTNSALFWTSCSVEFNWGILVTTGLKVIQLNISNVLLILIY